MAHGSYSIYSSRTAKYLFSPIILALSLCLLGVQGLDAPVPFAINFLFWATIITANWMLCDLMIRWLDKHLTFDHSIKMFAVPLIGSVFVAIPQTSMVLFCLELFSKGAYELEPLSLSLRVTSVSAALSLLLFNMRQFHTRNVPKTGFVEREVLNHSAAPRHTSALRKKIAAELAGSVIWVKSEDHYLRVSNQMGEHILFLGKLSDFVHEFSSEGLQVHRSWWVSKNSIVSVKYGRTPTITLTDGKEVPIGRSFLEMIRTLKHAAYDQ
ncbi:LytTr DNA-binding domain-containing protein [Shimia isoporae]|uniref:LytTr DNA-binding domain-containing protein n=1 Tax=Shimia isoporae TaxID=647720 RepID=A0A4R1NKU8_9RHOB|nr:LytTR family DNA-binding domain-containing protein [Shimia isoporae]TCL08289.1 LytTr DNA-binding domain-containing protein [Shimia isoporae]